MAVVKKKYAKIYAAIAAVVIVLLALASHFIIPGWKIPGVREMDDSCTVTVSRYPFMEPENKTEYALDARQIQQIKSLLAGGVFIRGYSPYVTFDAEDLFDIYIYFDDPQDYLIVSGIGSEYIRFIGYNNGIYLKITDPQWQAKLEAILSAS